MQRNNNYNNLKKMLDIRGFDIQKVWIFTIVVSILIAVGAILLNDPLFITLDFIVIIFLLLQKGENMDEKKVNSKKFSAIVINYFSIFVVFFNVGYEVLAVEVVLWTTFYAIAAYSLNLSTGLVGVLNFGVIAQVAVGSATYAVLTVNHDWPILAATLFAMIMAALFSALIAVTTLRLRDDYFAIVSITVGEIFRQILRTEITLRGPKFNGEYPSTAQILNIPLPFNDLYNDYFPESLQETLTYRFFLGVLGILLIVIVYYTVTMIIYSPYGRVLRSIREDELVTSTYGKNLLRYKVEAMTLSGLFAGLAGVYITWIFGSINPQVFLPLTTFYVWTVFIIGGRGTNKGIIIGAAGFVLLQRMSLTFNNQKWDIIIWLNEFVHFINPDYAPTNVSMTYLQLTLVGLVLILFIRFAPRGVAPEEAYRPLIKGLELPAPGSQSEDQKIIAGDDR